MFFNVFFIYDMYILLILNTCILYCITPFVEVFLYCILYIRGGGEENK